jgi:predicted nuclease with TOPRIM domain
MNYHRQNLNDLNVKYASIQESLNRVRNISSRIEDEDKIKTSELIIFYQRINDLIEDCITDQLKLTRIPKYDESEIARIYRRIQATSQLITDLFGPIRIIIYNLKRRYYSSIPESEFNKLKSYF